MAESKDGRAVIGQVCSELHTLQLLFGPAAPTEKKEKNTLELDG
ncbi:MAG: hypothetical protein ACETVZ_04585 [Phycisphaerae bacterium]